MAQYITKDGDMLDDICWQYYGSTKVFNQVLAANLGLANKGALLPAGISINLPELEKPTKKPKIKLW
jgi:phage tail protein X